LQKAAHGEDCSFAAHRAPDLDYVIHDPRVLPAALIPGWDEAELMPRNQSFSGIAGDRNGAVRRRDSRWLEHDRDAGGGYPTAVQPNAPLHLTLPERRAHLRAVSPRWTNDLHFAGERRGSCAKSFAACLGTGVCGVRQGLS
jgi:hypothetical protein